MQLSSNLQDTKDELLKKRAELVEALKKVQRLLDALEDFEQSGDPLRPSKDADRSLEGLTLPQAAERILRETGRPLHVFEVIQKLQARGYRHDEAREKIRVSMTGALARKARAKDTFVAKRNGFYGLSDWETKRSDGDNEKADTGENAPVSASTLDDIQAELLNARVGGEPRNSSDFAESGDGGQTE